MSPAGARPDHGDALALRRAGVGEGALAPGHAVDDARDADAAPHLVDAGVAGEAAADRRAAPELRHPVRIGDERAADGDEIRLALGDRRGRDGRIAEPADSDHGDLHACLDAGGVAEERRLGERHRRVHPRRRRQRPVMAGRDVERIGARLRRPDRDLAALLVGHAVGKIVLDREPVDDAERRRRGLDRAQHLEPEAGAVRERAAIGVGAAVLERGVELRDQIAVGGVDLDAVEAGLAGADRGGGIGGDGGRDARDAHRLGHDGLEGDLIDRMRDRRRRDRGLARDVDPGVAAAVAELDRGLGPAGMDHVDEAAEPGDEPVVVDAELAEAMAAGLLGRGHLDRDQADAAPHPGGVVGEGVLGDEARLVRGPRGHRRHHDPVRDLDRADPGRGEEDVHRAPHRIAPRGRVPAALGRG